MKTRLERQLTNAPRELLDHPEAARCHMEGCAISPPIARQIRDVLTTVQMANAFDGGPTDRPHRPPPPDPAASRPAARRAPGGEAPGASRGRRGKGPSSGRRPGGPAGHPPVPSTLRP